MSYKIAVGSSDGKIVDLKFGEVKEFIIFQVNGQSYEVLEKRTVTGSRAGEGTDVCTDTAGGCNSPGCAGNGTGCGGSAQITEKVDLIGDCRCIVCKKIGFQAQKQLERRTISVFDIGGEIDKLLEKITAYYGKLDKGK